MLNEQLVAILNEYLCPITLDIMFDPVVTADGFSYEKSAFLRWLETGHKNSPQTNEKLKHDDVTPNHSLRSRIQNFRELTPAIQRGRKIKIDLDMAIKLRE